MDIKEVQMVQLILSFQVEGLILHQRQEDAQIQLLVHYQGSL